MSVAESVRRALDYIEANLEDELDLSAIAAEAYLSVAQLYRAFYALVGHPVKEYVRKRKMSIAAQRLRDTDRSIDSIAWEAGFETAAAFAKSFKRLVGLTPAAYRKAAIHYSFERIRLEERVDYDESHETFERYPDVKVARMQPGEGVAFLHFSKHEGGIEEEAFRIAYKELRLNEGPKARVFGCSVDAPPGEDGEPRFGYRILVLGGRAKASEGKFEAASFDGGLYAVGKADASSPAAVQGSWDRLLAEWLPRSAFELDDREPIEEFVFYGERPARMNPMLPVRRKFASEPIAVVDLPERVAYGCRGFGICAQADAERTFIEEARRWKHGRDGAIGDGGRYYLSYAYGSPEAETYWWENGILLSAETEARHSPYASSALERKRLAAGRYAVCATRPYGMLTGVLERMHRWIGGSGRLRADEERLWYAVYDPAQPVGAEREAAVTICIPVVEEEKRQ